MTVSPSPCGGGLVKVLPAPGSFSATSAPERRQILYVVSRSITALDVLSLPLYQSQVAVQRVFVPIRRGTEQRDRPWLHQLKLDVQSISVLVDILLSKQVGHIGQFLLPMVETIIRLSALANSLWV